MSLKILHVAAENFAGVPYDFVKMHRAFGNESKLITLHANPRGFPEEVCLNFPLPRTGLAGKWRRKKVEDRQRENRDFAPVFAPRNLAESLYFSLSDFLRKGTLNQLWSELNLESYDIIHFDSGLDFTRTPWLAHRWKQAGKKIVCCYYGSDLRIRGIIPAMDAMSDLNITSEFDHLALKPDLHYVFYPYDPSELPEPRPNSTKVLRIVHSPTNRKFKGTDMILDVINSLKADYKFVFHLLEDMQRSDVLHIKAECDISIDQVGGVMGGTGYGKAGIETLAMGIPTITGMTADYRQWLPENPFVVANTASELRAALVRLFESPEERKRLGQRGAEWVRTYHSYQSVNERLISLYQQSGILPERGR